MKKLERASIVSDDAYDYALSAPTLHTHTSEGRKLHKIVKEPNIAYNGLVTMTTGNISTVSEHVHEYIL